MERPTAAGPIAKKQLTQAPEQVLDNRNDARKATTMMHPFMAGEFARHHQLEIARSRGQRNWKNLFKPSRQAARNQ